MSINKVRGKLYKTAKILGDVQALRSKRKGAIQRRIVRRLIGWLFGRTAMNFVGKMFR